MRREESALEFLDRPVPTADLIASLDDIDRLNAWFGGYALTLGEIARVAARTSRRRPLVVVDVGGGRGDLAACIVRWARRAGRRVRVVVIDQDGQSLRLRATGGPEITRVQADATALPIRETSADVVICALMLHHLERWQLHIPFDNHRID